MAPRFVPSLVVLASLIVLAGGMQQAAVVPATAEEKAVFRDHDRKVEKSYVWSCASWNLPDIDAAAAEAKAAGPAKWPGINWQDYRVPTPLFLRAATDDVDVAVEVKAAAAALEKMHDSKSTLNMWAAKKALAAIAAKWPKDKYSAGVARYLKAALEARWFARQPGGSEVIFESSPEIRVIGLRTGRRAADERVSNRVKLLRMLGEPGRAAAMTDARRRANAEAYRAGGAERTAAEQALADYSASTDPDIDATDEERAAFVVPAGSYRTVNGVARVGLTPATNAKTGKGGIFGSDKQVTADTADAVLKLDRALAIMPGAGYPPAADQHDPAAKPPPRDACGRPLSRVYRAQSSRLPLTTVGGKRYLVDLGFLSMSSANYLWRPKLKMRRARGTGKNSRWEVDEDDGLDSIKEFCRGWYSKKGLESKGEGCNYLVANARQAMGSDISSSSTYAYEKEVLFRPGAVFAVVDSFQCGAAGKDGQPGTKVVDMGIRPAGKPCPRGASGVTVWLLDEVPMN